MVGLILWGKKRRLVKTNSPTGPQNWCLIEDPECIPVARSWDTWQWLVLHWWVICFCQTQAWPPSVSLHHSHPLNSSLPIPAMTDNRDWLTSVSWAFSVLNYYTLLLWWLLSGVCSHAITRIHSLCLLFWIYLHVSCAFHIVLVCHRLGLKEWWVY